MTVERGIDRRWLEELVREDPVAHAWAQWDIDHSADRVRFLTFKADGRPISYLLFWFGLPNATVVHWIGPSSPSREMLDELPARPLIAIVPIEVAEEVARARGPATVYPLIALAFPKGATAPPPGSVPARRLTRADRPALVELSRNYPSLLTSAYAATDPGLEPVFGIFSYGRLVGVARAQATLPRVWIIGGVFTTPEHRGRGFGRALTAATTRAALDLGAIPTLVVREDNGPARHIYESMGYQPIARRAWIDAGVDQRP